MKILVTDGENRSALAATRSLGRIGHSIFIIGTKMHSISGRSRYCHKEFCAPDPMKEGNSYSTRLSDIVVKEKIDLVLPMTEQSIFRINKIRDQLPPNVILASATYSKMEAVSNKYNLFKLALKTGVSIPRTIFIRDEQDFIVKKSRIFEFPVVVKPALSKLLVNDEFVSAKVQYASDRNELEKLYRSCPLLRYPSLIQELISGPGTGLFTLFNVNEHLALFSHRRLLEKPPSGGVSVICESVSLDPEMVKSAQKLLSAVAWKGVAMVEFKRDKRDGQAKLIEINGRFWGSLQLAIASGVNFPVLYVDYLLGKLPGQLFSDYEKGQRVMWFFGILDHLVIRIMKGDRFLNMQSGNPSIRQTAMALLRTGSAKKKFDVIDPDDLGPFFFELKTYLKELLS